MPAVVPQLKTITVGGAAAGVGIEATSFRHGLVHDTLHEIEVLLPGGEIVVCTPGQRASRPVLRLPQFLRHARLCAAAAGWARSRRSPWCASSTAPCRDGAAFFESLAAQCRGDADFVDGVVFGDARVRHEHRPLHAGGALAQRLHLREDLLPVAAQPRRGLPEHRRTTSGAGTPTGSGARRISARSSRWCAGCSAASA